MPRETSLTSSTLSALIGDTIDQMHNAYYQGLPLECKNGHHFTKATHGNLHYRAYVPSIGDPIHGTLIAVHGAAHNSGFFHDFGLLAAQQGWEVIAFDLPGHGLSSYNPPDISYSYAGLCHDLITAIADVTNHTPYEHLGYLGSSLGGQLRMVMADQNIQFGATILNDIAPKIAPFIHRSVVTNFEQIQPISLDYMMTKMESRYRYYGLEPSQGTAEFLKASIMLCGKRDEPQAKFHLDPSFATLYESLISDPHYRGKEILCDDTNRIFVESDLTSGFNKISDPILLLRGTESLFFDSTQRDHIIQQNPSISMIEVQDVKHPVGQSKSALNHQLIDFFAKHLRA